MIKLIDETMYQGSVVEQILFGGEKKVEVKIFTDSKPLLDSVASSKQVEKKMMRPVIADMKEKLIDGSVGSYRWIETKKMVADLLTKEKLDTVDMDDIIFKKCMMG